MLPSPASQPAEPAAVSMRKPSIAPHLRAQMAAERELSRAWQQGRLCSFNQQGP